MKIVILARGLPTYEDASRGAFVASRAIAYARAGHEVMVIVPYSCESPLGRPEYEARQVRTVEEVTRIVSDFGADVVACHAPDPSYLLGVAAGHISCSVRRVLWVHGYEALYTGLHGYQPPLKVIPSLVRDYLRLRWLRKMLSDADAVVFVSEWLKQTALRNTGARVKSAAVIPNPVDTKLFSLAARVNGPQVQLVSVRGLQRQYGLDVAIKALAGIEGAQLTIVGEGDLHRYYVALARQLNSPVTFRSPAFPREKMPSLYSTFNVYLAPSRTETQGVAMCEAMSCGIPVIASRVGGIPEFVDNRSSGILVAPNDVRAFRKATEELIGSPAQIARMGLAAREAIARKCEESFVIGRELSVLQGC